MGFGGSRLEVLKLDAGHAEKLKTVPSLQGSKRKPQTQGSFKSTIAGKCGEVRFIGMRSIARNLSVKSWDARPIHRKRAGG